MEEEEESDDDKDEDEDDKNDEDYYYYYNDNDNENDDIMVTGGKKAYTKHGLVESVEKNAHNDYKKVQILGTATPNHLSTFSSWYKTLQSAQFMQPEVTYGRCYHCGNKSHYWYNKRYSKFCIKDCYP